MDDLYKYPRLYVDDTLEQGRALLLPDQQAHYLKNVMRREKGDYVRLFNGQGGEYLAALEFEGKRDVKANVQNRVRVIAPATRRVHLLFAPLKKDRLETLVEMAVQLGATDLHPVITDRTEVREVKEDKMRAHIIEAAEQCERLDLPVLHPLMKLEKRLAGWNAGPVFAGLERDDVRPLTDALVPGGNCAALIGPVGGWTEGERTLLKETKHVVPVSLGPNVLRSETAVAVILARLSVQ